MEIEKSPKAEYQSSKKGIMECLRLGKTFKKVNFFSMYFSLSFLLLLLRLVTQFILFMDEIFALPFDNT